MLFRSLVRLRELADLGFDHAILGRRGPWTEESIAALASILPQVHALGAGPGR